MTNQLDIDVRRSIVPAASEKFSLNETISGSGKKSDETDHQPRNLKIQELPDEIVSDGNSRGPYAVQRKRLFDDSDGLFAAHQERSQNMLNEPINPPKNPKIRALVDEIINESSLVKPHDEMKILWKKSVLSIALEKALPTAPPEVIAAVFQEMPAAGSPSPTEEEKVYPKESPPRTKGDIIGYSDEDSEDESSVKASTDNSSDEESKDDNVESEDEIKLLPATVDGLRKLWIEFMREEKQDHRNESLYTR